MSIYLARLLIGMMIGTTIAGITSNDIEARTGTLILLALAITLCLTWPMDKVAEMHIHHYHYGDEDEANEDIELA